MLDFHCSENLLTHKIEILFSQTSFHKLTSDISVTLGIFSHTSSVQKS